jgi:type VI secretion system protein ImpM
LSVAQDPPGWHGKLPSLGDFASRRLAAAFLAPWDDWLATGLQQLRERDPAGWLTDYLAAPSRRFLLMPGVLPGAAGSQAWAGILMPSVDRVGRYFPFTIAQALQPLPANAGQMQSLWSWLARLDELAAEALQDDWGIEQLEAELARMPGPELKALPKALGALPQTPGKLLTLDLPPAGDIGQLISIEAQSLWQQQHGGLAFWYACPELQAPCLQVSLGLPASAANLLGVTI